VFCQGLDLALAFTGAWKRGVGVGMAYTLRFPCDGKCIASSEGYDSENDIYIKYKKLQQKEENTTTILHL
jgi:hypothetical protein